MKSLFVFVFFCFFASTSFAAEFAPLSVNMNTVFSTDPTPPQPTFFDQLMGKFNQGTMPEFDSMIGWWTGRCYNVNTPNTAEGMMLAAATNTLTEGGDNGPDFPPIVRTVQNMGFITYGGTARADFFDNLAETERNEIARFLATDTFKNIIAIAADGSINADGGSLRYTIRKFGDHFYGQATHLTGTDMGKVYEACYFFRKIN